VTQVVQPRRARRRLHWVCYAYSRGVTSITTHESSSLFEDKQETTEQLYDTFYGFSLFCYWRIFRLALPHPPAATLAMNFSNMLPVCYYDYFVSLNYITILTDVNFYRLKVNLDSHKFILESGTVANSNNNGK
jgi:hypothetical protein